MLSCQTRTEIVTRSLSLGLNPMQTRLFAEQTLEKMVPAVDALPEDEGQRVAEGLGLKLKARNANRAAMFGTRNNWGSGQ